MPKGVYTRTEEHRRRMSELGKRPRPWQKGRGHTEATKKKLSESHKGVKSHFWKGGISTINRLIRRSLEYRLWREAIFKRDNYTCIWCGQKRGKLEADHIKPFAYYPELRFAIDNGRTLCRNCHRKTDTWGKNQGPV